MGKLPIADLSRQPLVKGTTKFTDPDGNVGFANEDIIASALVRIAGALETGRLQLPTAVFPIQPRHADEFRNLVADLVADRPGRVYIVAWHLKDEYTVNVSLAYERGESLIYLGRYWEAQRAEDLASDTSPTRSLLRARNDVHSNLVGYCLSLNWLTMLGEVEQGVPLDADQAWANLVFLQRKVQELDKLHQLLNQQLAEQEGGEQNG